MKVACLALGVAFVSSCGGNSERDGGAAGAASSGASSVGAQAASGATTTTGGSESAGGSAVRDYIPDHPDQPPEGDCRVTGGSFEHAAGFGWDLCFSRYPGISYVMGRTEASDGARSLAFDSRRACADSPGCTPEGGDAQFGFWLDSDVADGDPIHLYFDAIDLGNARPSGQIEIAAVDSGCESTEPLASIPLAALDLGGSWQTRCVSFVPSAPFRIFGVHVTGSSFYVGLDTFRFGPPCHD